MTELERLHNAHKERMARITGAAFVPRNPLPSSADEFPQWQRLLELSKSVKRLSEQVEAFEKQLLIHKEIIGQFVDRETDERPKFGEIISVVCEYYKVSRQDLLSARRTQELALPRMVVCFLGREMTGMSYPQMGRRLGGRDHTTALHGSEKIRHQIETDETLKDDIDVLKMKIGAKVIERRFGSNVVPIGQ